MSKTDENLKIAFADESQTNIEYLAYAHRALEEGFTEIRYIGWISPYQVYGERQLYTFDENQRQKFVDARDAESLLETVVDGVKVFDKV